MFKRVLLAFSVAAFLSALTSGQATSPRKVDTEFVHQQFGWQFTMVAEINPRFGDLDGDGVEDAVIAARCGNPLLDEAEHNYTVIDPYYTFFGYGDPKVTTTFVAEGDPRRRGLVVLIIHGAGPEAWRSPSPKAKFVVVNLPYRTLSVRKMRLGKKTIEAVYTEEGDELGSTSALFYDGKKYRYVPMGASLQ